MLHSCCRCLLLVFVLNFYCCTQCSYFMPVSSLVVAAISTRSYCSFTCSFFHVLKCLCLFLLRLSFIFSHSYCYYGISFYGTIRFVIINFLFFSFSPYFCCFCNFLLRHDSTLDFTLRAVLSLHTNSCMYKCFLLLLLLLFLLLACLLLLLQLVCITVLVYTFNIVFFVAVF